ncbi:YceD family protein [Kiloniella sp. b19]|uniref:YceD family protein n=1 Tax=Kiloniella sp. GXU_MW_B19 TaxID=3141326 RepID=UPI0031DC6BC8
MIENEFSRLYKADNLQRAPQTIRLKAKPEECAALADRFELEVLEGLEAELRLFPNEKASLLKVEGRFSAEVTQNCIISGVPLKKLLEEDFEILYSFVPVHQPDYSEADDESYIDMEAEDPPEEVDPAGIDFGEAVAQQLAVSLDPYPKAEGVEWDGESIDVAPKEEEAAPVKRADNPFEALRALKKD